MRLVLTLTFALLIISNVLFGQSQICGTTITKADFEVFEINAFRAFQQNRSNKRNNDKINIGITIHIVETVQGAANIEIQKLYDELDAVNLFFSPANISFFYCGAPRFIAGKGIYTYNQAALELNSGNNEPNTINIFYLDEIGDTQLSQFACGISQFPWRGKLHDRFILMQKGCSTNGATLAHELGHYFGLFHTHETFRGRELVNGSNCDIAGDLLCDTPADPNLGATGLNGCTYEANFVDANGDTYRPNPANIMSYSPDRCQMRFSPMQNDLMNFYLETTDLNTIVSDCDHFPDYAIDATQNQLNITSGQIMELIYSFDNQGITKDQEIEIFWKLAQEGEIELTIHKDTLLLKAGSGSISQTFYVEFPLFKGTGNYVLTTALDPNSKILERDKRNNFHRIDIAVDNSQFSDVVLFPNPVQNRIKVFIRDRFRGGKITMQIVDRMGRIILEEERFKNQDEFFTEMDVLDLSFGFYLLNIRYDRDGGESQPFWFIKE